MLPAGDSSSALLEQYQQQYYQQQQQEAVRLRFVVPHFTTTPGQRLIIVGAVPALGSWNAEQGVVMTWHAEHRWVADVELEAGWHGALEFKVALQERRSIAWEPGSNRLLVVERPRRLVSPDPSSANLTWFPVPPSPTAPSPLSGPPPTNAPALPATTHTPSHSPTPPVIPFGQPGSTLRPDLEVECEWGMAERPAPSLPDSMLCSTVPGVLATGQPISRTQQGLPGAPGQGAGAEGGEAGRRGCSAPVVTANCQVGYGRLGTGLVLVPWLPLPNPGPDPAMLARPPPYPSPSPLPGPADRPSAATTPLHPLPNSLGNPGSPSGMVGLREGGHSRQDWGAGGVSAVASLGAAGAGRGGTTAAAGGGAGGGGGGGAMAQEGLVLVLVGSVPALGCWDPALGLRLARDEAGTWRAHTELPMGFPIAAKLVVLDGNGHALMWEQGPDRVIRLPDPPNSLATALASSPSSSLSPAAATAAAAAGGLGGAQDVIMSEGDFLLLAHWGLASPPHLLYLPHLHPGCPAGLAPAVVTAQQPLTSSCTTTRKLLSSPLINLQLPGPAATTSIGSSGNSTDATGSMASSGSSSRGGVGSAGGMSLAAGCLVACNFYVPHMPTSPQQHLVLVGGAKALGGWDPAAGLKLRWGLGHTWQGSALLPGDVECEAKLVLWDGNTYRWELGDNRRLHPGQLLATAGCSPSSIEVLHILYWRAAQLGGCSHTPAILLPSRTPRMHAPAATATTTQLGPASDPTPTVIYPASDPMQRAAAGVGAGAGPGAGKAAVLSPGKAVAGPYQHAATQSQSEELVVEPAPVDNLRANSPAQQQAAAAAQAAAQAQVEAALEAQVAHLQQQLTEVQAARAREVEALRVQLMAGSKALAEEEDTVESLHAQLGSRAAEVATLQQQLARAEATATAAMAAATTALGTALGLPSEMQPRAPAHMRAVNGNGSRNGTDSADLELHSTSTPLGATSSVAAATFNKLTEQLAVRQLELDISRRQIAEAASQRNAEVAHLRAELSDAVACRLREVEAARLATANEQIARQQDVSALQRQLAESETARARDVAALQAQLDAVLAAGSAEKARLTRQLSQACAAVEALEAQLHLQREVAAAQVAHATSEAESLRRLLQASHSELTSLRSSLADVNAAAASRMALARGAAAGPGAGAGGRAGAGAGAGWWSGAGAGVVSAAGAVVAGLTGRMHPSTASAAHPPHKPAPAPSLSTNVSPLVTTPAGVMQPPLPGQQVNKQQQQGQQQQHVNIQQHGLQPSSPLHSLSTSASSAPLNNIVSMLARQSTAAPSPQPSPQQDSVAVTPETSVNPSVIPEASVTPSVIPEESVAPSASHQQASLPLSTKLDMPYVGSANELQQPVSPQQGLQSGGPTLQHQLGKKEEEEGGQHVILQLPGSFSSPASPRLAAPSAVSMAPACLHIQHPPASTAATSPTAHPPCSLTGDPDPAVLLPLTSSNLTHDTIAATNAALQLLGEANPRASSSPDVAMQSGSKPDQDMPCQSYSLSALDSIWSALDSIDQVSDAAPGLTELA
ncbi:hypothetical protein QJQ45_007886 [Haematococcus lacustris]|nr:hypothetical protein QJQ45_007886 [Haematococcus lacustris]